MSLKGPWSITSGILSLDGRPVSLACGLCAYCRPTGSNPFHPSRGPLAAILPLSRNSKGRDDACRRGGTVVVRVGAKGTACRAPTGRLRSRTAARWKIGRPPFGYAQGWAARLKLAAM
jgi:hypothetical protein